MLETNDLPYTSGGPVLSHEKIGPITFRYPLGKPALSNPLQILENVPLAPLTTLKVGGPARFLVEAATEQNVVEAFKFAAAERLKVFVLGGGSNIVVSDKGFDGLVVRVVITGISQDRVQKPENLVPVIAAAGEDWDRFVAYCVEHELAGVECLSGIPGLVGGTPVQNVGAYGQEVAETIANVKCYDRETNKIVDLSNEDCRFAYRSSIFNSSHRDRYVVLAATFHLIKGGEPRIRYRDLMDRFGDLQPGLLEVRTAVLDIRRAKSMVIDDKDPNSRSAGSFFKNPVVPAEVFENIRSEVGDIPNYPAGPGRTKLSAAWLIENAGFKKGYIRGQAGLSSNHTLAIINRGNAPAADILMLKSEIQRTVLDKFGIELQPEPIFVGF